MGLIYIIIYVLYYMLYTSKSYISPLPWSDNEISMQLLVLLQKIGIAFLLIFDPHVFLIYYSH